MDFADLCVKNGRTEVDLLPTIEISVGSVINQILLGYRFIGVSFHQRVVISLQENEPEFYRLKHLMVEHTHLIGHPLFFMAVNTNLNFAKNLPYFKQHIEHMLRIMKELNEFFKSQIEHNKKLFESNDDSQESNNYVQAYLKEMKKREEVGNVGDFT